MWASLEITQLIMKIEVRFQSTTTSLITLFHLHLLQLLDNSNAIIGPRSHMQVPTALRYATHCS